MYASIAGATEIAVGYLVQDVNCIYLGMGPEWVVSQSLSLHVLLIAALLNYAINSRHMHRSHKKLPLKVCVP